MNKNQSSDHAHKGPGQKVTGLTPKETSATPPLGNGASGEKSESGNRNKRS